MDLVGLSEQDTRLLIPRLLVLRPLGTWATAMSVQPDIIPPRQPTVFSDVEMRVRARVVKSPSRPSSTSAWTAGTSRLGRLDGLRGPVLRSSRRVTRAERAIGLLGPVCYRTGELIQANQK